MSEWTARRRILLGCAAMALAMIGDYLLGYGTIETSSDAGAYMGIAWNVAPDWRYAVSSVLGFACAALFAVAAVALMRVMEQKYALGGSKLYKLFRIANWGGILYFAFIHIGICMLPVVFNAGMAATGDVPTAVSMAIRVLKSIAVPLALGFIVCDGFVTVAWIGMVVRGMLPVKRIALIFNPVMIALIGQLMNYVHNGMDSGFESLGWGLMYLVCAMKLVGKDERV
ncbi:MAG: hypothetical protein IKE76_09885 [Clostridia bacterium]|nr:hypothetical protein [Clostridia bacterium]